ncbi:hypothetical protein ICE_01617 [Bacillus cereus BAG1X1-2]|uniref:hypothetical protein n=1 Tax=Bacillus cereus TaxID=1396 RepID=UPI00027A7D03|nr:hypothetical protein [Bacillus cereus]EJS59062.1 hypothetical protein ICE_01617 [Bacillus cereus BAG1X1-2]
MNIELGLKDLIPFGSAMIGAVTGGIITYKMNKIKDKKERLQKRAESILELQAKLSEMQIETIDLKMEVLIIQDKVNTTQDTNREHFFRNLKKYFHEQITGRREILLSLAIHIDKTVFIEVAKTYNMIFEIFGKTNKGNFQGDILKDFEKYLELVTNTLDEIKIKINKLMIYLRKKEWEYTQYFLKKYLKDISR